MGQAWRTSVLTLPQKTTQNAVGKAFLAKTCFSIIFGVVGALGGQKAAFYAWLAGRRARLRATLHAFLRGFLDFTTFAKTEKPSKNA